MIAPTHGTRRDPATRPTVRRRGGCCLTLRARSATVSEVTSGPSVWCPRCGEAVAPDLDGDGAWTCRRHGPVPPLHGFAEPTVNVLLDHVTRADCPTWLPWPLPANWSVSGVGSVGERHTLATVLACSGPDPLSGPGDLVVVAEEPGTGLGARYAGLHAPDPGAEIDGRAADAKIVAGGHPTPLWHLGGPEDREAYVGAAAGRWLWLVGWPGLATAVVLLDATTFVDMDTIVGELDVVPLSGLSVRLTAP